MLKVVVNNLNCILQRIIKISKSYWVKKKINRIRIGKDVIIRLSHPHQKTKSIFSPKHLLYKFKQLTVKKIFNYCKTNQKKINLIKCTHIVGLNRWVAIPSAASESEPCIGLSKTENSPSLGFSIFYSPTTGDKDSAV